jgi:hypothetical protein
MYENPRVVRLAIYVRPMSDRQTTPIKVTDVNGWIWIDRWVSADRRETG